MKVIDSKILVQVQKGETATTKINGISIPVGIGEYDKAIVLSVGPRVEGIKEGDILFIYPGAGKEFTHEGNQYKVITTSEVIVVL